MKIAHVPFCWFPDPPGGTEIYVRTLALAQRVRGHEPCIIAPGRANQRYERDGLAVFRYAVQDEVADVAELYAGNASVDSSEFARIIQEVRPDVLHIHGVTRAITRRMLAAAKQSGARIVLTYHTPTTTCVRGTLMRWGHTVCEGDLDSNACAACMLQSLGMPRPLSALAARTPRLIGTALKATRFATALRMRELVGLRHDEIRELLRCADQVVATSSWVLELLIRLGVPRDRVTLNRQGTLAPHRAVTVGRATGGPLRMAFFGRIDRSKGLDIVAEALRLNRDVAVELHVFGIAQDSGSATQDVLRLLRTDARITLHDAVPHEQLLETMQRFDAVVVPSQLVETGPLVVLEAFAAGVPVIGSRLGGIAELVKDGHDGLLVEAASPSAWAAAIRRLASDAALLEQLRAGIRSPRTMDDVAAEMDVVYQAARKAA